MSPRVRRAGASVLVVLVTLLLLIPAAEIVVRLVKPQTLPSQEFLSGFVLEDMYVPDDAAGYRLAPDFEGRLERSGVVTEFRTNSLGMRGDEPGPKTRPRILALGDSYTFGWGVGQGEEWIHVTGEEIARRLGRDAVETWNGGVNGYGTAGALAALERIGPELRPDVVLLGFFANDFTDNLLGPNVYEVRDGRLFDRFSHDYMQEHVLARESHLFRLVSTAWETARIKYFGGMPTARPARQFSAEEFDEGARLSAELIGALDAAAERLGAEFAVIWLPADVYAISRSAPGDIPVRHALQQTVENAGIRSFDLLPVATSEQRISGLYIRNDGHFSARGNRVAGRAIAGWLLEAGLVPE